MNAKNYLRILLISGVPIILFCLTYSVLPAIRYSVNNTLRGFLVAGAASTIISFFVVIREKIGSRKKLYILLLLPTTYSFPVAVGIYALVASIPFEKFHL